MNRFVISILVALTTMVAAYQAQLEDVSQATDDHERLVVWQPGYLDIHHINTGRGDAAFFVFPDGTTMLFDAGDLDVNAIGRYAPLKVAPARPNDSKAPGSWIADYIRRAAPENRPPQIDYAVVSHFHPDHFGNANKHRVLSSSGNYRLSGFAEVGNQVPINTLIDRGYPDYDFPTDLRAYYQSDDESPFHNYLMFAEEYEANGTLRREQLSAGSDSQIGLKYDPDYPIFSVRNVKSGESIWSGAGGLSRSLFTAEEMLGGGTQFSENPLSLALLVSYGEFQYFTGGDNTGFHGVGTPQWFDVETPMGEVVGEVDVMTLNHHGNRDATNANFLAALAPRVIVQQSWVSDHPGGEVAHRMLSEHLWNGPRDIFSTNMAEETKVAIGPWMTNGYSSFEGHIVIRVEPGGEQYRVFVLHDQTESMTIKSEHGPYDAKRKLELN